jgi:hypothetical protein
VLVDEQEVLLALDDQIGREQLAEQAQLAEAHARVRGDRLFVCPLAVAREQPVGWTPLDAPRCAKLADTPACGRARVARGRPLSAAERPRATPAREPASAPASPDPAVRRATHPGTAPSTSRGARSRRPASSGTIDEQHRTREATARQHVAVAVDERVLEHAVAHGRPFTNR